jgi:hypothetical protein
VVTVFSDDNKKYLSTDLLREEPARAHRRAPVLCRAVRAARRDRDLEEPT